MTVSCRAATHRQQVLALGTDQTLSAVVAPIHRQQMCLFSRFASTARVHMAHAHVQIWLAKVGDSTCKVCKGT